MKRWQTNAVSLGVVTTQLLLGRTGHASDESAVSSSLWKSVSSAFDSSITWVAAVALLILAGFAVGLLVQSRRLRQQLRRSTEALRQRTQQHAGTGQGAFTIHDIPALLPERGKYPRLHEQWEELSKSVLWRSDGSASRTAGAEDFFDDEDALQSVSFLRAKFSFLGVLPGLMTGVGMLGTFGGISIGLGEVGLMDDGGNLMNQISGIVVGLASAFWTSIFGLLLALVFSVASNFTEEALLHQLHGFREALEGALPRASAETLLEEQTSLLSAIRSETEESRSHLQQLANDLVDKLGERIDTSFQQHLVPQLSEMTRMVRDQISTASDASVEGAQRFTSEMVASITGGLQDSFGTMGRVVDGFSNRFMHMARGLEHTLGEIKQAATEQRSLVEHAASVTQTAQHGAAEAARELEQVTLVTAALEALTQKLASAHQTTNHLQTQQAQLQRDSEERVGSLLSAIGGAAEAYQATSEKLAGLIPLIHGGANALASTAVEVSSAGERAVSSLQSTIGDLGARATQEKHLLEAYQAATRDLGQALSTSRASFEGLLRAAGALEEVRVQLGTLTTQLGENNTVARDLAWTLQTGIASARDSLDDATRSLASVAGATEDWAAQASKSIETFGTGLAGAVRTTLQEYDRSLANAVQNLVSAMQSLDEAASSIERSVGGRPVPSARA